MHCWCRKQAGYRLRTVTVFFFFCGVHSHCITYKRRLSLHRSALSVNLYSKLLLTPNRLSKVICGTPNTRRHDRHHLPEQMSEPPKPPYAPLLSPNTNPSLEHFFRNAQQSNQQEPEQLVGNNSQFSQRSLQEMRQLVIQQQEQQERRSQRAIQDALRLAANVSGQQYSANPVQHQPSQSTFIPTDPFPINHRIHPQQIENHFPHPLILQLPRLLRALPYKLHHLQRIHSFQQKHCFTSQPVQSPRGQGLVETLY